MLFFAAVRTVQLLFFLLLDVIIDLQLLLLIPALLSLLTGTTGGGLVLAGENLVSGLFVGRSVVAHGDLSLVVFI